MNRPEVVVAQEGEAKVRGEARVRSWRPPRWARVSAAVGAAITLIAGSALIAMEALVARYEATVAEADLFGDQAAATPEPTSDIEGPLNILLVGVDTRPSQPDWVPRADSVLVMHVPAELDRGYLFSLPRDLWVDIPAFAPTNYDGGTDKLAHAMFHGARVPGSAEPDPARGFELLATTVGDYTGIERFDAGAIIDFTGFRRIVDAMGGVTMSIDQDVTSVHRRPDGRHREPSGIPGAQGADAYVGPRKQYTKGTHRLKGWEALDYVRQRYIEGGDYARQRHQRQFLRAMADQALSRDVVTDPLKLDRMLRAAGEALTFNGRGHTVVDFAIALRDIRPGSIVMVTLPGDSVIDNGRYIGEQLRPVAQDFFAAVNAGTVDGFVLSHPDLVSTDQASTDQASTEDVGADSDMRRTAGPPAIR